MKDFKGILTGAQLPNPQDLTIPDNIGDFLEDYVESIGAHLSTLEDAVLRYENVRTQAKDAEKIQWILHKIKGISSQVGMHDIASFVHEVENAFEALNPNERPDMLLRFKDWTIAAMNALTAAR